MDSINRTQPSGREDAPPRDKRFRAMFDRAASLLRKGLDSSRLAALALGAVACVFGVCVWARSPRAASARTNDPAVDAVLMRFRTQQQLQSVAGRAGQLTSILGGDRLRMQVPASSVRCTPFVFGPAFQESGEPTPVGSQTPPATQLTADSRSEDLARLDKSRQSLQLESILTSPDGAMAVISGRTVKEGHVIEGWRVCKILTRSVLLECEDQQITLALR